MNFAKSIKSLVNQIVIVGLAPSISRNAPLPRLRLSGLRSAIIHRQHDDASHAVQHPVRIAIRIAPVGQIVHLPGVPGGQPFIQPSGPRRGNRRAHAAQRKA